MSSGQRPAPGRTRRPSFQPVRIIEIELTGQPTPLVDEGPVRILVRHGQRPVAFVPLTVPRGGLGAAETRAAIDRARAVPPDPGPPARPAAVPRPTASVVVTTCVASPALLRTIEGIRRQSHRPHEIIVVDNRPATSGVAAFLDSVGIGDVRVVAEARPGLSRARNAGLAAVSADIVAFVDDDVEVDRGWLAAVADAFADDDTACVTGLVLPMELQTRAQCWFEEFGGFSKGFQRRRFDLQTPRASQPLYPYAAGLFGTGANTAFRTTVLRGLGGFDEGLGMGTPARGGEDLDIYLTVLRTGRSLVYEPAALIWHRHHRQEAALRRQIHNYGIGMAAMIAKRWIAHPEERGDMLRRLPAGLRHLLHPASPKHAGKGCTYPKVLTLIEFCGVVRGPFAYWLSRRAS